MTMFSILVQVRDPIVGALRALVASLEAQTFPDWELVLTVDRLQQQDRLLLADLAAEHPKLRIELRKTEELLAWACNDLLPDLGTWVGFMEQHDRLAPTALAAIAAGIAGTPSARIVYTDEEARDVFEHVSLRHSKGAINPLRLRHQEYLTQLAVIQTAWLSSAGGFDRLASDRPTHDLYLRALESLGPSAFLNIPERLYWRRRDYLAPKPPIRRQPHMVDYDLHAVKQHLTRKGILASVTQGHGTLDIEYAPTGCPSVTVVAIVTDQTGPAIAMLRQLDSQPQYQPLTVRVLYTGTNPTIAADYRDFCAGLRFRFRQVTEELVPALNQEAATADCDLLLFLQGTPINPRWLHRMVDHAQIPGITTVGARTMSPLRLTQPGVLGWKYEGWDWNSRGRFNLLTVPHEIAAVSPTCLLTDLRRFLALGGFNPNYPTLYGHDYCLRAGTTAWVPGSQVHVTETVIPAAEAEVFSQAWAGWIDPFGVHQSL